MTAKVTHNLFLLSVIVRASCAPQPLNKMLYDGQSEWTPVYFVCRARLTYTAAVKQLF